MSKRQSIGIFDSGVGGLSVVAAIRRLMPAEDIIYLADTQFTPYGEKSNQLVTSRVHSIAEFLAQQSIKLLVVACNTATAAAVQSLRDSFDIPIVGLEPALKPAVETTQNNKIGVLATRATLQSEKYLNLRRRFEAEVDIIEKASPLFVELVESATSIGESEFNLIRSELDVFIKANVDSLVLGCTHYPFLTATIKRIMGDKVTLFESAAPVAEEVKRRLASNLNTNLATGQIDYYSSAPEKAQPSFDLLVSDKVKLKNFDCG